MSEHVETARVRDRLSALMSWEPGTSHMFGIIRRIGNDSAIALSIDKADQLADEIERLRAEIKRWEHGRC